MRQFIKHLSLLLLLLMFLAKAYGQVDVQLSLSSPSSLTLDALSQRLRGTVINTSGELITINFSFEMTTDYGLSIRSARIFLNDIDLEAGEMRQFDYADWSEVFSSNVVILPVEEEIFLRNNQLFKQGNYTICLKANTAGTNIFLSQGCTTFTAKGQDPPEITFPGSNKFELSEKSLPLRVDWFQITQSHVDYRIEIADASYLGNNIGIAGYFEQAPQIYKEEDISAFNHIVEDVDWEVDHTYAIRVSSYTEVGEITGRSAIHSRVRLFKYISEEDTTTVASVPKDIAPTTPKEETPIVQDVRTMNAVPHYPMNNDTLPFLVLSNVVELFPKGDQIKGMNAECTMNDAPSNKKNLTWNGGAKSYLNSQPGFENATDEQASLIPISNSDNPETLVRGKSNNWHAEIGLIEGNNKESNFSITEQTFVTGMPKPKQISPAANASLVPGDIKFNWKTAGEQAGRLLPKFQLFHIENGGKVDSARLGKVQEHWVLEVFKSNDKNRDNLVQQFHNQLDITPQTMGSSRLFDSERFEQIMYGDLEHTFNITEEGNYWWRIAWLRNPDKSSDTDLENLTEAQLYHSTALHQFIVGTPELAQTPDEPSDCLSNCVIAAPNSTGSTALGIGSVTKIGKFELKISTISGSEGNGYKGDGIVEVAFLNNLKLKVDFDNIKANAENRIYSGIVKAKHEGADNFVTNKGMLKDKIVKGLTLLDVDKATAKAIDESISNTGRLISTIAGTETALPVGWDFEVDEKRVRLAITDIDFSTTVTNMGAIALADIPYISDDGSEQEVVVSLAAKELCINPGGINGNGKFYVPEDVVINPNGDNVFTINGLKEAGSTKDGVTRKDLEYTYLQWDCKGFKAMSIAMQIKLSRDMVLPEDDMGKVIESGNVIASAGFNLKKEDEKFNLISKVSFSSAFQLAQKNAEGWSFEVSDAWLDLSTVDNPIGITFPEGYIHETADARLSNTWKGFWVDKIAVKAPHFIESSKEKVAVTVNDFIIDPKLTFSFVIENLVPLDEDAAIDGTHLSIDSVFFDMVQNDFKKAGFNGRMALPIAEDEPSQMFNYQVLFDNVISSDKDGASGLGLVMAAKPGKGGVKIVSKGFMMNGTIAETSFIELGIGRKNYTKFELNGTFNISTDFDNDIAKTISLQMPGIKIEGMKFDSSNPDSMFVCDDCFKTSLASPQKTMSGFPLSLESIKGGMKDGNPVLSIEPMISLMGDDDKFAASTKIDIIAKMGKVNGKWDFGLKEVDVKAISLDATISKISVKGELEFYDDNGKKGTKGNLAVVLPAGIAGTLSGDFGTYKKPGATAAKFDTKEWYSYWQLDGTIMFGKTGMPFGAVALYGVGGGASYHMTQGSLPNGSKLTSAVSADKDTSKSEKATASGADYTPDFNTGLGLKFTSLFGSLGGGEVYNFDVTLSAEFNNNNGLRKLGLEGNARILPDKEQPFTKTAPIQAYVHLGLERLDNPDNLLITGDFIVTLNMLKGTLKGIGSAADNPVGYQENILVDATFKSDKENDEWYFIMGTPKKRAGISVSLGKIELASVTGYFLAGNALPQGITLGLPAPTQAFLDIQARARGGKFRAETLDSDAVDPSIVNGAGGDINKKASGFQFGLAMSTSVSASALFYFDLGIAVGFDLLMKNVETCRGSVTGSTFNPGWYSQGQFYAGIYGEFGIEVDLWFIQGKFPILEASAALLLQGNIPEPVGFKGEGDIAYSILGDLISGNYHFEMVVGEECIPYVNEGGVLNDLDIIQDIKPAGGNNVSVFSKCAATFAISVDKTFDIPISKYEIVSVRPFIKKWTLTDTKENRLVDCKQFQLTNENNAAVLEPIYMFDGHRKYTQYLRVEAEKKVGNGWTAVIDEKTGKAWYNDEKISFTTGAVPDVIVDSNVVFTYPIHDQKHFLKKETASGVGLGYVALKLAQDKGKKVFDPSTNKDFIARFVKIDGTNEHIESPLTFTHARKTIKFRVNKLENDQVYLLQLVSKDKAKNTSSTDDTKSIFSEEQKAAVAAANNQNTGFAQIPPEDMPLGAVIALQEMDINILSNKLGSSKVTMKERKLPEGLVFDPSEKILYEYYFKTSRFDKFEEKVADLSWNFKFNKPGSLAVNENATFDAVWEELPEKYDKEGRGKVKPLINVTIDKNKNYYLKTKVKNLNDLYNSIKAPVTRYRLKKNGISRKDYSEGVDFAYESKFDTPLSKEEINYSFETEKRDSDKFNTWAKEKGTEIEAVQSSNSPVATLPNLPNGNYNNSSYSPTAISGDVSSSNTSSGYQYAEYFITGTLATVTKTPNVRINHRLPKIAYDNMREMRRAFLPTVAGELELWKETNQTVSGILVGSCHNLRTTSKSTHFVNMYKKRYSDKQLYKYIINKPTGGDFLRTFDRTTYNRIGELKGYYKNLGYPKYADNGQPIRKSISFMLQYQYPIPTGGTSVRMQPGSKVNITN